MADSIASTSSATGAKYSAADVTSRLPATSLGQADFLKLLVTQMTTQDPLQPQTDPQFIAQMAQFSTLQQSTAMQADLAQLNLNQKVSQASSLLGRAVTLSETTGGASSGIVSAVQVKAGTPQLIVNGQSYDLSQVLNVQLAETPTSN